MQYAVSTMAAHRIGEDVEDSKQLSKVGVITVSIAVTQPVLSWVVL
jgi:hypothetical protein